MARKLQKISQNLIQLIETDGNVGDVGEMRWR